VRDTLLWLGTLAAVALIAGTSWWIARRNAGRTPGGRGGLREQPLDETWLASPRPGDIWWADVPYEDGTGHKVRPCLVLRTYRSRIDVLKITSQDQSHRTDHVEIPTRTWDRRAEHNSYLDLTGPLTIRHAAFQRRAGTLDASTWRQVRRLHPTGWGV
jgi:hypothetical protein